MSSPDRRPEFLQSRIESERRYHDDHYRKAAVPVTVAFDLATMRRRRPYNLTWAYYDRILECLGGNLAGRKVLVAGCGTGLVALNLAYQGARVDAFDVSGEAIAICRRRAEHHGLGVRFFVSSFEELELPENSYDAVVGEMILHHIDIPTAAGKMFRFLKRGGSGVFSEWKIYPVLDAIRSWPRFRRWFPPGGVDGYATEYERKLSAEDFAILRERFPNLSLDVRYCLCGKVGYFFPRWATRLEKLDYRLLCGLPWLRHFTDGVILRFSKPVGAGSGGNRGVIPSAGSP